jgi:translocation and assembly module TamA
MRLPPAAAVLALVALLPLLLACRSEESGPAAALERDGDGLPRGAPVPYRVVFPSDLPPELATLLPQVSTAERDRGEPPDSRLGLRQRAERDVALLGQALRAEGYFDATVGFALEDATEAPAPDLLERLQEATEQQPRVTLAFDVAPGPRYQLGDVRIELADNPDGYAVPPPAELGLVAGAPARTQPVIDAEEEMLRRAREAGFALARLGEREAVVDHATRRMDVTLRLEPERRASFGQVTFTGGEGIDPAFLRGRVPFATGERYDPKLIEESRSNLFDTDLFSTIVIRPADRLTPDAGLDTTFDLRQRPPRSIGAALGYQSDLGPNARLFWEHRNFFGAGERFRAQADLSLVQQSATVTLTKPDFLAPRQDLLTDTMARRDDFDAYKATSIGAGVALQRELSDQLTGSLGVAFRYAEIEDVEQPKENFALLSLPGSLNWDFSNDELSPTRGGRVLLTAAPFVDLLDTSRRFFKARVTHTRYLELTRSPELVLALRGSLGSIFGVDTSEVPADERFYAGGGGSIRGIAYQKAGPLDDEDDPLGGRSVAEGSVELRLRLRNDLGAVLFVDGGTVFDGSLPTGGEEVLFGVGPGLRYFTPIGPVRVDLGFPINPRSGVDDAFQLYISIGQAF